MAKTRNGVPTEGHIGGWSYFVREGEGFVRISTNKVPPNRPLTRARAEQLSKMQNLIHVWRCFHGELKGCFENRKPAATDYSGFLAANLPEARVFLPKGDAGRTTTVADNFYVSVGTLLPAIHVEEGAEWLLSDISVGPRSIEPDMWMGMLAERIVKNSNGAFLPGDEILFVSMSQGRNINTRWPEVQTTVNRLPLEPWDRHTVEEHFAWTGAERGFRVVDGRLSVDRREGELVAWIRVRREKEGRAHVTTQRLVGSNPLLARYMGKEAIEAAVASYRTRKRDWSELSVPQIAIEATSNDISLGVAEGGGLYAPGAPVTLRAVAREGGRFLVWDDGCQQAERQLAALRDGSYKAIFVRE